MHETDALLELGWRPFFAAQTDPATVLRPGRVLHVHRGRIDVAHGTGEEAVAISARAAGLHITVGDWVLLDAHEPVITNRLQRQSLFRRRAAGTSGEIQLIAANVDTLFIVTSANRDFNPARLERYLAIAGDAGAFPVIVITKADVADADVDFRGTARELSPGLLVELLDGRDPSQVEVLRPWCGPGQTVALLGSSGVGKSTLINTLAHGAQATRPVRADDQRGRHTTTSRSMHRLPQGGWLVDTPGMRELQLVDVSEALDEVFAEIATLAQQCRFADCAHESEPGCAVLLAIEEGRLEAERLKRYRKLHAEDRRNTETLADRRARDRKLGRLYRSIQADKRREKGGQQ